MATYSDWQQRMLDIATSEEIDRRRQCSCGSGHIRQAEYDARGIFLCYACDKCRKAKLSRYRPDVLTDASYWHDEPIDEE